MWGGEGRGGAGLLRNFEEHIDNIITPLMHHRNTANEDDRNEGMCDWDGGWRVCVVGGGGGFYVSRAYLQFPMIYAYFLQFTPLGPV